MYLLSFNDFLFTEQFKTTIKALPVSGAGTEDKVKCHFFEELSEICGYRPIVNQSGIDSVTLPLTSGTISECLNLYLIATLQYQINYYYIFYVLTH